MSGPIVFEGIEKIEIPEDAIPDYDTLITEDDTPVDNLFSEKQMRLLTEPLYATWAGPGEGRSFLAAANIGLFYARRQPALVPDVLVSLDVEVPEDLKPKPNRSYFIWEYGKPPDVVIEIVSNKEGGEAGHKFQLYATIGVKYYVIFDPLHYIQTTPLRIFVLHGGSYRAMREALFNGIGLGLTLWHGVYERKADTWLRWVDTQGDLILTGAENTAQERQRANEAHQRADEERQRADEERQRADEERQRADAAEQVLARMQAHLKALGIDLP